MKDFIINMGIIIFFLLIYGVAIIWVDGIDNMKNLHPEYKGEDFP